MNCGGEHALKLYSFSGGFLKVEREVWVRKKS